LAKLDVAKDAPAPVALQNLARERAAQADRDTTDVYARQAVISTAADTLAEAGLMEESDAMLAAELKRSHSPYYYMLGLAANAKKRKDSATALTWHEKAYAAADGPATRLQWGVSYVNALVELSPADEGRIEKVAGSVIGELEAKPDTFYDRNRRGLERMGRKLAEWNKTGAHGDSVKRIEVQMHGVCTHLPKGDAARESCERVLRPAPAAA
jgi:hypothetical protein